MDPMWDHLPLSLKNRLDDIDFKHKTRYPDACGYAQLAELSEADAIQILDTILESFKVDNLSQAIELLAQNNRSHPTIPSGPGHLPSSRRNTKPSRTRQTLIKNYLGSSEKHLLDLEKQVRTRSSCQGCSTDNYEDAEAYPSTLHRGSDNNAISPCMLNQTAFPAPEKCTARRLFPAAHVNSPEHNGFRVTVGSNFDTPPPPSKFSPNSRRRRPAEAHPDDGRSIKCKRECVALHDTNHSREAVDRMLIVSNEIQPDPKSPCSEDPYVDRTRVDLKLLESERSPSLSEWAQISDKLDHILSRSPEPQVQIPERAVCVTGSPFLWPEWTEQLQAFGELDYVKRFLIHKYSIKWVFHCLLVYEVFLSGCFSMYYLFTQPSNEGARPGMCACREFSTTRVTPNTP